MIPRNIFWNKKYTIPNTGGQWILSGYSRAAYRSGFYIDGLDILLDAGPQCHKAVKNIFITHTHGDHIANLPFTLIRDNPNTEEESDKHMINIYAPIESEIYLHKYIKALFDVNALKDSEKHDQCGHYKFIGVDADKITRDITLNNNPIRLETVKADHGIPTVVYGFSLIKKKLNDLYKGLSGKEIVELKKKGVEVSIEVAEKKMSYILDTSIKTIQDHEWLLEYPSVIIECTFIFDDELENASKTKHIHWQHLKPYVLKYPQNTFILTHFSLRYKDEEIQEFFNKEGLLPNVILWLTDL